MIKLEDKIKHIKDGGYTIIVNVAENILLRPNDMKKFMSEERFYMLVKAEETILDEYKEDEIYKYYYGLNKVKHGFCTFERWKNGMLF